MKVFEFVGPIRYNQQLNPKLWNDRQLRPEVKSALLKITNDFKKFVGIPFKVEDVRLYGANVNYNYTEFSDLDLHLVVDFDRIMCDREVEELFDSKRRMYKDRYNVTIRGIPVEPYVENIGQQTVSSSYSLLQDRWLVPPNSNIPEYDSSELAKMVEVWQTLFEHALRADSIDALRSTMTLLRMYRKKGLETPDAEFSIANLAFKSLRNDGTIDTVVRSIDRLHDQELSLKELDKR